MTALPILAAGVFSPQSPQASAIVDLFYIVLVICAGVFVIVTYLVTHSLARFRSRSQQLEPSQVGGHKTLELVWTVGPLVLVIWIFVLTVRGMSRADPVKENRPPDLTVTGHQWWWEIHYKSGAVVANEIHIPVGEKLLVQVDSTDVIHAFWVPQLARKIDMIKGHPNQIWLQADHPGTYLGVCAEYCGTEHAWMRFLVVVDPAAEFNDWEQQQLRSAPASLAVMRGARLFQQMTCVNCHAIKGTGAQMRVGPDLTHVGSRQQIGAGILDNTPANMTKWLKNPQAIKSGVLMPNPGLTDAQAADLAAYFAMLK